MKLPKKSIFFLFFIAFSFKILPVQFEPDDLKLIIIENREYLKFIDVALSNLTPPFQKEKKNNPSENNVTTDEKKNESLETEKQNFLSNENVLKSPYYSNFMQVNQLTLNGDMLYLEGRYNRSYKYLKKSQQYLKVLYRDVSDFYLDTTQVILQYFAPIVIQTDDSIARYLLKKSFTYLKKSKDYYVYSMNLSKFMYRDKLIMYKKVIIESRKARRYAILAYISSKTPKKYQGNYRFIDLDEAKKTLKKVELKDDYKRINFILNDYVANGIMKQLITVPKTAKYKVKLDIFEIHDDNYKFITNNRVSFLNESNAKIKSDDILIKEELPAIPEIKTEEKKTKQP